MHFGGKCAILFDMNLLAQVLPYLQIVLSVIIVTAVLLQRSGASVGGALGGGSDSFHSTRRGFEKFLFVLTIVCAVLFALSALGAILISAQV